VSRLVAEAFKHFAVTEYDGPEDNPIIMQWAEELGLEMKFSHDSDAWCTLFVSYCVHKAGLPLPPHEYLLWSQIYAKWGTERQGDPALGDVVVTWRGQKGQGLGHVRIFLAKDHKDNWVCIGGNQSNSVSVSASLIKPGFNLVSVRVPPEPTGPSNELYLHQIVSAVSAA
jgi:uncharacterized protein (TIGR02594 family)